MWNDWIAASVALAIAGATVESIGAAKKFGLIDSCDSRKLTHAATGIVYMLTWPWYSSNRSARWICAGVVTLFTLLFALAGAEILKITKLVESNSRSGKPSELLLGPLQYGLVHIAFTVIWWRESPAGMVGLACLIPLNHTPQLLKCAGDGFAALVGQRLRLGSLPHNKKKSYAGSITCFLCGLLASVYLVSWFNTMGHFTPGSQLDDNDSKSRYSFGAVVSGCAWSSLVATIVESFPTADLDNVTMSITAALVAAWSFN